VLDPLRRRDQRDVNNGFVALLLEHLFALRNQPLHRLALLSPGFDLQEARDLDEAIYVAAGFLEVVCDGLAQRIAGSRLGHLGQCLYQLILSAIQIADLIFQSGLQCVEHGFSR
jgi:hypothetical protein